MSLSTGNSWTLSTLMQKTQEVITDSVFLNPDLDAEVTITLEPTDTVQQTVTEILGDVDSRLLEDSALEKLNNKELGTISFLEPEDPSPRSSRSRPPSLRPRRSPSPCPSVHQRRPEAEAPRGSVGRLTTPRTSIEFGWPTATSQTRSTSCRTIHWRRWGA